MFSQKKSSTGLIGAYNISQTKFKFRALFQHSVNLLLGLYFNNNIYLYSLVSFTL